MHSLICVVAAAGYAALVSAGPLEQRGVLATGIHAFVATTITTTNTVTTNVIATAFSTPAGQVEIGRRDTHLATFSTFPANSLSSACSCILTAAPTTATITSTTVTVSATATAIATIYQYALEWNEDGCRYSYPNINDHPQPDLSEQQAIDDCAQSCSNDPSCVLFEAYFDITSGGETSNIPRCATFADNFDASHLLCPVPGYDIGYSVGAQKNF